MKKSLFKRIIKKEDNPDAAVVSYCMQDMSLLCPTERGQGRPLFSPLLDSHAQVEKLLKEIEAREQSLKQFREHAERLEQEAYEKGFAQGEKAGRELGEKRFESVVKSFTEALRQLREVQSEWYEKNEQELVSLVCAVARKVVQREVSMDKSVVAHMIRVALKCVADHEEIVIRMHPSDLEYMSRLKSELKEEWGTDRSVRFEGDEQIARGDAVIESKRGMIETGIEKCLLAIECALREQAGENIRLNREAGKHTDGQGEKE